MGYPRERIQKHAKRFLEINNQHIPIDVDLLAKKHATIKYIEFPLQYNKIDGLCIKNGGKSIIVINSSIPENRKRFTLAHELGHLILPHHHGFISCNSVNMNFGRSCNDFTSLDQEREREREANIFAAELLMPKAWVVDVITKNMNTSFEAMLKEITTLAKVSVESASISIIDRMPSNHAIIIRDTYSNKFRDTYKGYFSSNEYYVDIASANKPLLEIASLCKKAYKTEEFLLDNYKLYYLNFNYEYRPVNYEVSDIVDPNELLMFISKDLYGAQYLKFNCAVNGIVGAINSNSEKVKMTEAQFKGKVISRLEAKNEFAEAPKHKYFDDFLDKKYKKVFLNPMS